MVNIKGKYGDDKKNNRNWDYGDVDWNSERILRNRKDWKWRKFRWGRIWRGNWRRKFRSKRKDNNEGDRNYGWRCKGDGLGRGNNERKRDGKDCYVDWSGEYI